MTEYQAYMLIGTLWLIWSFLAHHKDDGTTALFATAGGGIFFGAAVWVAAT